MTQQINLVDREKRPKPGDFISAALASILGDAVKNRKKRSTRA
jgi:hypothetical protein